MELNINNINFKTQIKQTQKISKQKEVTSNPVIKATSLPLNITRIPFGNEDLSYSANDFLLPKSAKPDIYQIQSAEALKKGNNTIVTAPTGTGKTAIAHFIIKKNFEEGKKTFYTTPLKALSNQKYNDLKKLFGNQNVGILTGDRKENTRAPIVIMTTEIYRNMVESNYFEKRNKMLDNVETVIFDEFHYMGDPDRGSVWEESIMYTPKKMQILALSATVGNNKKITSWINEKKLKATSLIDVPTSNRHVPLKFLIIDTQDKNANSEITEEMAMSMSRKQLKKLQRTKPKRGRNPMSVITHIEQLNKSEKLPAIAFVFSKSYSQTLLDLAEAEGATLTNKEEQKEIKKIIDKYIKEYDFYSTNLNQEALMKGYAIHSAAILPLQKQLIEELFNKKLIKVVFATETLAAGINMPARTVIMTDAQKPSSTPENNIGQNFLRPLSPNEFHQMSGRAGRRGIDKIGYVMLLADSDEKSNIFEELINSAPNRVESNFKIDASNVTGFYNYQSDISGMEKILDNSFSLFGLPIKEKEKKHDEHIKTFNDYTKLLRQYNYLDKTEEGYKTNEKGLILNSIKGRPQIPIVNALLKNRFNDVTPMELAGLIAAITMPPMTNEPIMNEEYNSIKFDESTLKKINNDINRMLRNDFYIDTNKVNFTDTNDKILSTVEERHKGTLRKDTNKLYEEKAVLTKLMEEKEEERSANGYSAQINKELGELNVKLKKVKSELSIKHRYKMLKDNLERRLGLEAYKYATSENRLLETFQKLEKSFEKYNHNVMELKSPNIPLAKLNPTTMIFVKKWAQLNSESHDYIKNWDKICEMLKDTGSVRYEGDLFNAISQTIDFLHQFQDAVTKAEIISTSYEQQIAYNNLKEKCKVAVKLLKNPPLYNSEEI